MFASKARKWAREEKEERETLHVPQDHKGWVLRVDDLFYFNELLKKWQEKKKELIYGGGYGDTYASIKLSECIEELKEAIRLTKPFLEKE